jgi:hypothetical protein
MDSMKEIHKDIVSFRRLLFANHSIIKNKAQQKLRRERGSRWFSF